MDVWLLGKLALMAALFFHGASPERRAAAAVALAFFYVARVGLLEAAVNLLLAPVNALRDRLQPGRAAARAAAAAAAAANGGAGARRRGIARLPDAEDDDFAEEGQEGGGGEHGRGRLGDGSFFTPLLTVGRGYLVCDLFAAIAGFFVSLWPQWQPLQQLDVEIARE